MYNVTYRIVGSPEPYRSIDENWISLRGCKAHMAGLFNKWTGKSDCVLKRGSHSWYEVRSGDDLVGNVQIIKSY